MNFGKRCGEESDNAGEFLLLETKRIVGQNVVGFLQFAVPQFGVEAAEDKFGLIVEMFLQAVGVAAEEDVGASRSLAPVLDGFSVDLALDSTLAVAGVLLLDHDSKDY